MKKNALRLIALIFTIALAATVLTGCFGMMGEMPKVTNEETNVTVPYEQRKLVFVQNAASALVNTDTPIGYFCYEDNQLRILTPNSKTEEHDDSISYTITVYNGSKAEGAQPAVDGVDYTHSIKENGYLYLNSKVLGDIDLRVSCANGSAIDVENYKVAPRSISLFDVIIGAMGLYLLYSAIVGKGKLFQNDFIKEGMEQKHKTIVRITSLVIGILMIATVAIALLDKYGKYRVATLVIFGLVFIAFIISAILLRRCTDQEAKRKAMTDRYAGGGARKTPAAAFIFDGNEPTVDDVKKSE